jgi:hypothetical protein
MVPEDKKLHLGSDGKVITYNRATRRRKPPTDNWFTKKTHRIMKIRKKNAPTKQQRIRATAKARKARKADYSQVS